ncbi:hypothetical protein NE169_19065 [Clostridium botulinum]|uniref:hypothetical protein n=1 Tax=Clostridium botulinum TaxID=1491 RepID=UPI0021499528|nr:hypothetical protein [Clostridium botulinum]MCR1167415.1 hypothetical protein [Clostridium botulinum]
MNYFFIKQYFSLRWKRWLTIIPIIFFSAVLLKYLAPIDFLPANKTLILKDYMFESLSYPFYILFVAPLLYCHLIYDIATKDYEGGYITFIISRIENRVSYFISKILLIIITANIYFFMNLFVLIIVGLIFRLPLQGECYSPILKTSYKLGLNIYSIFLIQYGIYFIGLIAIGISVLVISLLFNNGIYSMIFIVMCFIQSREAFFNNHKNLKWSLIGQLALSKHYPFCFSDSQVDPSYLSYMIGYTAYYSIKFYIAISLIAFLVGMLCINKINFNKKM